ncbi:MAG: hypothetical protein JWR01_2900 [Subtercola sp.]|nr:hypothetical protein [Subtercola sp.]
MPAINDSHDNPEQDHHAHDQVETVLLVGLQLVGTLESAGADDLVKQCFPRCPGSRRTPRHILQ